MMYQLNSQLNRLVDRFLAWPLPDDVAADICATTPNTPHRSGTNLLTATQAEEMLLHVLEPMVIEITAEQRAEYMKGWAEKVAALERELAAAKERVANLDLSLALCRERYRDADRKLRECQSRADQDRADAERYRWLRDNDDALAVLGMTDEIALDEYIDATRATQKESEKENG